MTFDRRQGGRTVLTYGGHCVVFALCEHHDPLPVLVHFGQALHFLCNFSNILGLQRDCQSIMNFCTNCTQ